MLYYRIMEWGSALVDRKYLDALFGAYPERMNVQQLAEALNQSKQTTYKWLQHGVIPAYQIEKTWLISRDEVRDWVWENRNTLRDGGTPAPNEDQDQA